MKLQTLIKNRSQYNQPDVVVSQVGPQEGGHNQGKQNQDSPHSWRAGLGMMDFWPKLAYILANLELAKPVNQVRTQDKG